MSGTQWCDLYLHLFSAHNVHHEYYEYNVNALCVTKQASRAFMLNDSLATSRISAHDVKLY